MLLYDVFRDPVFQGIGVVVALILGLIGFYYAGKQKFWLYIAVVVVLLLVGSAIGAEAQRRHETPQPLSSGKTLKMDSLPFQVFDYGQWQNLVAPKYFSYFYVVNDVSSEKGYKLEFSQPPEGDTATGISFTFTESQNLAEYDFIELKATFLETDTRCDLYIRDITMNISAPFVTLGSNVPSDIEASLKGNTWKYRIPLKTYFKSVDWKAVKEIGFNAWRFEGKHTFIISDMSFVKP
jgi:hypothetical protein